MIPIDPLFVPEINIIQGSNSPVNIKLNFKNANFIGFSTLDVTRVMYVRLTFNITKSLFVEMSFIFTVALRGILKNQILKSTAKFQHYQLLGTIKSLEK